MEKRQILFRALIDLKKFKVMIEGVQVGIDGTSCSCPMDSFTEAVEAIGWKINNDDELVNESTAESISMYDAGVNDTGEDWVYFDNCEIMQYSGVDTRDGVKIYEQDILRYRMPNSDEVVDDIEYIEAVQFVDGCFSVEGAPVSITPEWCCEVIGNMFQNSDLIPA